MDLDKLPESDLRLDTAAYPSQEIKDNHLYASRSLKVKSRDTTLQVTRDYPAAAAQSQIVASRALSTHQAEAARHVIVPPASLANRNVKHAPDELVKLFGSADFFIRWVKAQAAIVAEEVMHTRKLKKHQALWQAAHAAFRSELDRINSQKQDALKAKLAVD